MFAPLVQVPAGLLGLPSLHSIIQAIAGGFFGALAGALVPSWLKHGTIATIQQLVALPDPASWTHVGALQSEMTYLGAMLAPVTLTVGALRYWAMGLTGSAHPVSAVTRCAGATAALVGYRWGVGQVVAGTNTLTHGVLALPSVSGGLQRIVGVLFGGALLSGAGGVFGAFLVIVGVVFAAGLFAAQVLLTVVLALLIVVGPPLIALAAIPELAHLARIWRDALLAIALIPLGWTVLFATAGALCLDATSFTGGAGGLPGHVAAAFAGLITFFLAVRLPFVLLGGLRGRLGHGNPGGHSASSAVNTASGERVKSARARLRAVGLEAIPAMGASVGRAAGALGAPAGGPLGAARRTLRTVKSGGAGPAKPVPGAARPSASTAKRGARQRLREASDILIAAPGEALRGTRARAQRVPYPTGGRTGQQAKTPRAAGKPPAPAPPGPRRQSKAGTTAPTSSPQRGNPGPRVAAVSHTLRQPQANLGGPSPPERPGRPAPPPRHPDMHVVQSATPEPRRAPDSQRPAPAPTPVPGPGPRPMTGQGSKPTPTPTVAGVPAKSERQPKGRAGATRLPASKQPTAAPTTPPVRKRPSAPPTTSLPRRARKPGA